MITAVDSSVLLDVYRADPEFGPGSKAALARCLDEGVLSACDVVWAEVSAFFESKEAAREAFEVSEIGFSVIVEPTAQIAATAWREYRKAGGKRTRLVGDFLVGAHAQVQAERLLTRDRGFYRSYFKKLAILDPAA